MQIDLDNREKDLTMRDVKFDKDRAEFDAKVAGAARRSAIKRGR
ncbi:hypothetical protein [Massilia sp. S19_KUP03_FR1]